MTRHNYAWILIPRYFLLILPTYVRAAILNFMLQVSTIVSMWRHEDEIQINCLVVKFFWVLTKSWSSMTSVNFVWLEKDSTKLVFNYICIRLISSSQHGLSEFIILIAHIQSLLSLYNYFEVKYVKRQANIVAHTLAREAYSMSRRCILDSIPRYIETLLSNEIYWVCFCKKKKLYLHSPDLSSFERNSHNP
jgi:hypothetical protein